MQSFKSGYFVIDKPLKSDSNNCVKLDQFAVDEYKHNYLRLTKLSKHLKSQKLVNPTCATKFASVSSSSKRLQLAQNNSKGQQKSQHGKSIGNILKHLLCGALSAVVSKTVVAPLERIKFDMIINKKHRTIPAAAISILQNEGLGGFWRGNAFNLLRIAPFKAINFFAYDVYRSLLVKTAFGGGGYGGLLKFVAGGAAGITATITCFPLDVMRTRFLTSSQNVGPVVIIKRMLRYEGIRAFYTGILPSVISMAPAGAVFYGTYDVLKTWALQRQSSLQDNECGQQPQYRQMQLSTGETLLFGGLAGLASEVAVYPCEVLRREMQLQSAMLASINSKGTRTVDIDNYGIYGSYFEQLKRRSKSSLSSIQRINAATQAITRTNGLRGFYYGLLPNTLQVIPNAAIGYFAYEFFKVALQVQDF